MCDRRAARMTKRHNLRLGDNANHINNRFSAGFSAAYLHIPMSFRFFLQTRLEALTAGTSLDHESVTANTGASTMTQ